jgi:PEP-CTERM motif
LNKLDIILNPGLMKASNWKAGMKRTLLSVLFVAGLVAGVYGQGTVSFQNAVGGVGGMVYNQFTNNPFNGTLSLELFYGPVGDTEAQILALNTGTVFLNATVTAGKFFDGTTVVTTGAPGTGTTDPVNRVGLVITAWTGSAVNYQASLIAAAPHFSTFEFDNPTGGAGVPSATPANLVNWLASNPLGVIPEPGTIVLGGLGAAVLLLFRRRK